MTVFSKSMRWKRVGKAVAKTLKVSLRVIQKSASTSQATIGHLTGTKRYAKRVVAASDRVESALESLTLAIEERDRWINSLQDENHRLAEELRRSG